MKVGQYLANIWTRDEWLLFLGHGVHPFNGLFSRTVWVNRHQEVKPFRILMKQEMMVGSGISWTICKSFTPRSRQITMPYFITQFLQTRYLSCRAINSINALKASFCKICLWSLHKVLWHLSYIIHDHFAFMSYFYWFDSLGCLVAIRITNYLNN